MATHSARPQPAQGAAAGWLQMVSNGVAAWSELAQLAMDTAAAQAKALGDFYAAGLPGMRSWPSQQEVLLLVESQAEQFADGCRHTLDDLERRGEASPSPLLPD